VGLVAPVGVAAGTDVDGETHTRGAAPDIGADEKG
jgi:hypothetical protein